MAGNRAGAPLSRPPSPKIAAAPESSSPPWQWRIEQRSLIILLPIVHQILGWAPWRGGPVRGSAIINHQIAFGDHIATGHPRPYLTALVRRLGLEPRSTVAMMTGVDIGKVSHASACRADLKVGAWCTAGCSNALRIGDSASAGEMRPGTINLALVINQPLSPSAMAEALAMAAEARTAAMLETGIASTRTRRPATGTGTDCITVASPLRGRAHIYCGKHTLLGELIGKAVLRTCTTALRRSSS